MASLLWTASCGKQPAPGSTKPPAGSTPGAAASADIPSISPAIEARLPVQSPRKQIRNATIERIGDEIIWCTPQAPPDDAKARDTAASVLSHLGVLSDAAEDMIVWGGLSPGAAIDPAAGRGLLLDPVVWAGCYLSCFVFSGPITLDQIGDSIVLRVPASFRSGLPAGDYPHPLWHSGDEWSSYSRTSAVEFVFTDERLLAAYRREDPARTPTAAPREWDGNWRWYEGSYIKPRVADFAVLFSEDNPHVTGLNRAYRDLLPVFTAQNCLACHVPDNPAGASSLIVLALPNQALVARASLAAVMIGESDGPSPTTRCGVASLRDLRNVEAVTNAAVRFLEEGDGATEYEWIRLIRRGEVAPRISP